MIVRAQNVGRSIRLSTAIPALARAIHVSARRHVQRLLWAGSVLDQSSNRLKEVPKDWFLAMGMQDDVQQGLTFNSLCASPSHLLIAYTTLPPSLPVPHVFSANEVEEPPRTNPAGLHKVAAIGRNTYGELGLGFASHEGTWGMVVRGFEGSKGIQAMRCGLGTSWIVTEDAGKDSAQSRLYSFGNHTSGQLGLGGESTPYALSEGGEPQLQLYASPRHVELDESGSPFQVQSISSGLDHSVILIRRPNGRQEVLTCGINTDGQLGDRSIRISSPALRALRTNTFEPPLPPTDQDPIVGVAAGGDTSAFWTRSGRVWAWGNSEYAQALVQGEAIDRIDVPTEASETLARSIEGKVVDIRFGGSFVVLLDDLGNVYTAGFGAIGQGKDNLLSHSPRKILTGASQISAGLEQASAVVHNRDGKGVGLAVWGLDSAAGRLSLGTKLPYPSYMIASRFTPRDVELRVYQPTLAAGLKEEWTGSRSETAGVDRDTKEGIIDVVHGRDAMFVLVEDGEDEVGRWKSKDDQERFL